MKALVLTGIKQFEIQELDTPEIQPNEVLINTAYAGVCGTDHDLYAGRPGSAPAVPPIILGHENSGVVAAIGSEVTNVKVGDRVAVDPNIYCGQCEYCLTQRPELCDHLSAVGVTRNGGLAEQFTAPATVVYKLPDNVSLRDAAAIEPVSCAVHGLDLLKLRPYQKALVIGDGFMGQIFAQLLQAYGVHQVDLAGIFDEKLQRNKEQFGVTETYNTTREQIPADSYDVIVEAVGLPTTQAQAVAAAKKGDDQRHVIAIIGDGSMSGGLAFEGLNNSSTTPNNLLIILNDNDMAIDRSVGGMKQYLFNLTTSNRYNVSRLPACCSSSAS